MFVSIFLSLSNILPVLFEVSPRSMVGSQSFQKHAILITVAEVVFFYVAIEEDLIIPVCHSQTSVG